MKVDIFHPYDLLIFFLIFLAPRCNVIESMWHLQVKFPVGWKMWKLTGPVSREVEFSILRTGNSVLFYTKYTSLSNTELKTCLEPFRVVWRTKTVKRIELLVAKPIRLVCKADRFFIPRGRTDFFHGIIFTRFLEQKVTRSLPTFIGYLRSNYSSFNLQLHTSKKRRLLNN